MPRTLTRREDVELFGPTVGDRIRLGDTDLWAEVEKDYLVPGDECVFGGGKTLRDGLGVQGSKRIDDGALDFVISNVVVIDAAQGIVKCDIGIKDGRVVGIGKAGNPDIMDGVHPDLIVGAGTDVRSAEGMIATAGGIDVHVHFDSAGLCEEAISAGVTTMLGGGLGPVTVGICSSGTENLARMLQAAEAFPLNFGFLGNGSANRVEPLLEQIEAGAIGLKIHEDWGATPAAIRASLDAGDELDLQVQIHTLFHQAFGALQEHIDAFLGQQLAHEEHADGLRCLGDIQTGLDVGGTVKEVRDHRMRAGAGPISVGQALPQKEGVFRVSEDPPRHPVHIRGHQTVVEHSGRATSRRLGEDAVPVAV